MTDATTALPSGTCWDISSLCTLWLDLQSILTSVRTGMHLHLDHITNRATP